MEMSLDDIYMELRKNTKNTWWSYWILLKKYIKIYTEDDDEQKNYYESWEELKTDGFLYICCFNSYMKNKK